MIEKSPIRFVALKLFAEEFGDLISVPAEITPFERSVIEGTYELLFLGMFDGTARQSWAQSLRAAFSLLDNGALKEPQLVWASYIRVVNEIVPSLHASFEKRHSLKAKKIDNDTLIESRLNSYKSIYEGLLPLILAPVVYAFGVVNDREEKSFLPRQDGRINLAAIRKMEKWVRPPQNRLAIGLNNHVRNAYSHENYRVLDHGRVVLHDVNPSTGKIVWGPETWTTQQLGDLCDQVWLNSLAIVCALALYGINFRKLAIARSWGEPTTLPPLRERDFKTILEGFADETSFDVKRYYRSNQELSLTLAVRMKGIDQDEKVYFGGDNCARGFRITVKYIEERIVEHVTGLLQRIRHYLDEVEIVCVKVTTWSGEELGEIRTTTSVIMELRGPRSEDIGVARRRFEVDTLGEQTMFVRKESLPIEI